MSQIHGQSTLLSAELAAIAAELTIDGVRKPPARAISGLMIAGSVWRHPFGAERWANEFRGRVVAVYCVHGHEVSQAVCGVLKEQGVEAVVLTGGFEAWKDAGLVVEPVEATDA
ncbi:hypothetical protein OEG84_09900 [Hoeflea sp. G2-23]|uniref:Rhodanese domain-containing protein n=1 Tax=Hoeflea algicola TaxID=2983763 RepID=A0ABT3Z8B1_9HYPH|nr:rhodanese-like domain-containing protein [Hoeflea algicola]MCY0148014.1 hypothetical protein [Hoeflea algicola]